MLVGVRTVLALLVVVAGLANAESVADLQSALPAGWKLTLIRPTTDAGGELVISHTAPVKLAGMYFENAHITNTPQKAPADAPTITLELRYRLQPKWSDDQVAKAQATNAAIGKQLEALRTKYRIDDIPTGKGMPLPATADEQKRYADYQADYAKVVAQLVKLPRCTLGGMSVFDDDKTYSQLKYQVEPASAMREAFAIVELVKRRCR